MYVITGFIKSTTLFLNAVYFPSVSPSSFQLGFPTNIVVSLLVFPDLSTAFPSAIFIFVLPLYVSKFPNVILYKSVSVVCDTFSIAVVIVDISLSSIYTFTSPDTNVLDNKYLSLAFTCNSTVLFVLFIELVEYTHSGSTTSTITGVF